jgi:hypothetical protein
MNGIISGGQTTYVYRRRTESPKEYNLFLGLAGDLFSTTRIYSYFLSQGFGKFIIISSKLFRG